MLLGFWIRMTDTRKGNSYRSWFSLGLWILMGILVYLAPSSFCFLITGILSLTHSESLLMEQCDCQLSKPHDTLVRTDPGSQMAHRIGAYWNASQLLSAFPSREALNYFSLFFLPFLCLGRKKMSHMLSLICQNFNAVSTLPIIIRKGVCKVNAGSLHEPIPAYQIPWLVVCA